MSLKSEAKALRSTCIYIQHRYTRQASGVLHTPWIHYRYRVWTYSMLPKRGGPESAAGARGDKGLTSWVGSKALPAYAGPERMSGSG